MDLDWMKYLAYGFAFLGAAFGYAAIVLGMNLSSTYFFLLLPAGLLALLSYIAFRRVNRAKVLRRLRSAWGKEPKALKDDQESIGDFFDNAPKADGHIDERTWQDLNMDTVFSKMNHTLTISGQQVLYRMLRNPIVDNEETLKKRDSLIRLFQEDKDFRERIQLILHDIGDRCGTNLSTLLWTSAALKPSKLMRLYHVLFGIALLSPLPLLFSRRWLFLILGIYFINTNLHYGEQRRIRGHFDSVRSLARLMRYGEKIIALNHPALREETRLLSEALSDVRGLRKAIAWVGVESPDAMFGSLQQYFSIYFLLEVRGFLRAMNIIEQKRKSLQLIFEIVGELDSYQAIASYRTSLNYYCEPTFWKKSALDIKDLYHPLVKDPVPNSVKPVLKGVLVTGSNMSGKSTLLRALGINALLSQTIYTCLARSYCSCFVQLITSIGRVDNVVEGKSYYLEEALAVKRMLDSLNSEVVSLLIFDEMFRGTNSEERIAAGYRVLKYIVGRNALVFTATHDLELTDMLHGLYQNVHFSERVGDLGLEFDYKLKPGPATTKNAIALLRFLKYPLQITDPVS